ncbi:MAG TPA: hypothetical protein VMS71_05405, partial [Candidatus Acidoferrum sp.]|nr:hypothetical protein [Candidatus Acidoferrum sp.]
MRKLTLFLCLSILTFAATGVLAADTGRNIREFVTDSGRIDLNAIRASGYQGALDLKGVNLRVDPKTGAPLVDQSPGQAPADNPDDVYWDNSISPSIPGLSGIARAMTVYSGMLVVGGAFNIAGGVQANNIAAWDGNRWYSLGSGVDDTVYALAIYDGSLIAGGRFYKAGGVTVNHIASWDGSGWSPMGTGMSDSVGVFALTVYDNQLIAGGYFTRAGGSPAYDIASWNGSTWGTLGSGVNHAVFALTVY